MLESLNIIKLKRIIWKGNLQKIIRAWEFKTRLFWIKKFKLKWITSFILKVLHLRVRKKLTLSGKNKIAGWEKFFIRNGLEKR